ncbi:MAG: VanZ family protein [Kineosporiaceae bacterium]|nr:VanZ family protein [Kineosporiaceae bacterium]MBK7621448.1 VanZ family protein [Kineosporiaceae bacterium]MBK8077394.1 VanZ family protein [Kineosporiaceae bacterium]
MNVRTRRTIFVVTVLVHLVALYSPKAGVASPVLGTDKIVHMALFGVVLYTGVRAGLAIKPLVIALLANAVISELAQYLWLARRSGDVWDAVADALGVLLVWALLRWRGVRSVVVGGDLR